jgi:hypothetical protein
VERHEREIFPLLHKRYLFAGVENFLLYDFFTPEGHVNEDVFAYSNRVTGERALVLYHNRYQETRGWVRTSVVYAVKSEDGEKRLVQRSLGEGLDLRDEDKTFTIFRDHINDLEYIRSNRELHEKGLYTELGAYKHQVFLDFRQVRDTEWHQYAQLAAYLDGRGVPSIDEALKEVLLQPVHRPFRELVNADLFRRLMGTREDETSEEEERIELADTVEQRMMRLLQEIRSRADGGEDAETVVRQVRRELEAILALPRIESHLPLPDDTANYLRQGPPGVPGVGLDGNVQTWSTLFGWLFTHALGKVADAQAFAQVSRSWQDEWLLGKITASALQDLGLDEGSAWWATSTIKILTAHQRWFEIDGSNGSRAYQVLHAWLEDDEVQRYLRVNRYQDVLWFNAEAFEQLLWWMTLIAAITVSVEGSADEAAETIAACHEVVKELQRAEEASEYRVEGLLEAARA